MEVSTSQRRQRFNFFSKKLRGNNIDIVTREEVLGKGEQGTVYKANVEDKRRVLAVKKLYLERKAANFVKAPFSKNALKHEGFIEYMILQLTNTLVLQRVCPHFVLNYGYGHENRKGVCDDLYPKKMYIFNEYISNSESLYSWMEDIHSEREYFNVFFQIMIALAAIQRKFNLVHSDLHGENIFVKKVKKGGYWKYKLDGKTYYVPNLGYFVILNDFGHGWIEYITESWYIRQSLRRELKGTNMTRSSVDVVEAFMTVLEDSNASDSVKNIIEEAVTLVKLQKGKALSLEDLIYTVWGSYFFAVDVADKKETEELCKSKPWFCYFMKPKKGIMLEAYDLDKTINLKKIPTDLIDTGVFDVER